MSLNKPYPHIFRPGPPSVISPTNEARKSEIAINHFASYEILKKDLKKVFEYIEPNQRNFKSYSHRTFELLIRACMEVESLCKLVFEKNMVRIPKNANIIRFSDLEGPMRLSKYEIISYGFNFPPFKPFEAFSTASRNNRSPVWYKAYNKVKHNRTLYFGHASLENVIYSVGGVYALLVAQFGPGFDYTLRSQFINRFVQSMPSLFSVNLPEWGDNEKYNFDWNSLKNTNDPFDYHPIDIIP